MSNQEILEKAIKKAGANYIVELNEHGQPLIGVRGLLKEHFTSYQALIFNHDFAKALWGEEKKLFSIGDCNVFHETAWKEHLRRMVIADDPVKYLADNM